MRELDQVEVSEVSGGVRSLLWAGVYDGLKWAAGEIADHYSQSEVAVSDDPSGRGRALL